MTPAREDQAGNWCGARAGLRVTPVGDTGLAEWSGHGAQGDICADRRGLIRRSRWPPAQVQGLPLPPRGTRWTRLAGTWSATEDITRPSPGSPRAILTPQSRGQDSWAVPPQVSLVPVRPSSPLYYLPPLPQPWGPEPRPGARRHTDSRPPRAPQAAGHPRPAVHVFLFPTTRTGLEINHRWENGKSAHAWKPNITTYTTVGQRRRRQRGRTQVEVNGLKSRAREAAAGRRVSRLQTHGRSRRLWSGPERQLPGGRGKAEVSAERKPGEGKPRQPAFPEVGSLNTSTKLPRP